MVGVHAGPRCYSLWMRASAAIMVVVMYFAPAVFLADATAHAAPIVDPRAPIPFQPTVTQSSAGVPVINIAAPNAQGLSVSQFQTLSAGPEGLIFNNSLISGTSLNGGQIGANPNLGGRTASTILAQVTSTGSQYASVIAGPLEIFGNTAALIIANPNGISIPGGTALTNISNLTLTTGTPQFVTGVGGSSTDFAHAGALAYSVNSGNISINGPPGSDGTPGVGIAGTVGNLDLIAQTVNLNAPLNASQRVNIITGNQLVSPISSDATGTGYTLSSNGSANTASSAGLPAGSYAIDASRFGSVTAGQVYIVGTAAGLGVNMQGSLMATTGNVVVNANGDVSVAGTFANQNVGLTSTGNTSISGTGLANQNYTVNAGGDISSTGAVSAGQDAVMTSGGNLNAASVASNGNSTLTAANSMTLGSVTGQTLVLHAMAGDLTVNSALGAPGTITAVAGRDLTVNGAGQGGSTVTMTATRNAAINGAVSGVGDTTIVAQSGTASVAGDVRTNGALTVSSSQGTTLGGSAQAQGSVSIAAQSGAITGQGSIASSQDAVTLQAGTDIGLTGSIGAGKTVAVTAGGSASLGGAVTAPGVVSIAAIGATTIGGSVTSGDALTVTSGGNLTVNGSAASVGNMSLASSGGSLSTTGTTTTTGTLTVAGVQGVSLGGNVTSQGDVSIGSSAGNVTLGGSLSTAGSVTVNAGQDATVAGSVQSSRNVAIAAARDASLNGDLSVNGTGDATIQAGRDINGNGALSVANDTTLTATRNVSMSGAIATGNRLAATAGNNLSVGATTAVGTETLAATGGSATLGGDALSGGALTVTAGKGISAQGSVKSLGDLNLNANGGDLVAASSVSTAGNATLNASGTLALNGQTTVSNDATLAATNITTQGVSVGGNLKATATQGLDTSAGQLNAAYSSAAPALTVAGNATLLGANVTTANAVVGGEYAATGTTSLTTGGTAAYQGDATLTGSKVMNVGQQMAKGNLSVSGANVTNQGSLSSLAATSVSAANLNNSGTIYGPTNVLAIAGNTTNSGGLLGTDTLTLSTTSLNNSGGLIFSGDVNNPTTATGSTSVKVTGGNGSFNNTAGQILAQNVATLALPYQALDPSALTYGTVNGGYGLNLSAQSISNSGTWVLPGTTVSVSATQGIYNHGSINQGAGTLALNGAVSNAGTINAYGLTVNGSLVNQAGATVQASGVFTLNGAGVNAGTVEAVNALNINGSSYDNSNGTTKAGNGAGGAGNMTISLSGDLRNAGGTLAATNDLAISANNVINTATSGSSSTSTSTTVVNGALVTSTNIGTETRYHTFNNINLGDGGTIQTAYEAMPATLGDLLSVVGDKSLSPAVVSSGTVTFAYESFTTIDSNTNETTAAGWVIVPPGTTPTGPTMTFALPTVTETTTVTGAMGGASSVIAAGHNLNLTANSLNNQGGTVSAGNDATLNIQALSNGGPTFTSTVTDSVDASSLNAFLSALQTMQQSGGVSVLNSGGVNAPMGWFNDLILATSGNLPTTGAPNDATTFVFNAPGTASIPSVSSTISVQGQSGQIVAGHNLNLSGGNLTNGGSLVAGNDVHITASSFTNQGTNTGTMTTTAGCASGFSGCTAGATTNPNSQSYSYQQINATVAAGNDLVIAANTVNNTYGDLVARRNVVIGGAGTSAIDGSTDPAALTQAGSVTNTSGSISAGYNVDINAATLTNTIAAPVQVHQNYGSGTPFTGCTSNCEAYVDVQSANPATITANHDVNLSAGNFSNTGSLITGLNNVTINASGSASTGNQYESAYWSSGFTHYGKPYATWGCANNPSLCASLYGGAYDGGASQDPAGLPSSVGLPDFVPATIQAGNTLSIHSPTLTNSGNVVGQTVSLSGSQLVNGLTNPNVYTPPPAVSGQVITLGPPSIPSGATTTVNRAGLVTTLSGSPTSVTGAAGLPSNAPIGVTTVGKPSAPAVTAATTPSGSTVKTVDGQSVSVSYLSSNPAAQVMGDLTPASLLAALPANLQPGNVPFYYDPYTEDRQVEQAALQASGKSSFYSTTSATDSTSQSSIAYQDKAALYGAALEYAKQNNIALGTQLSDAQLALVNAPMLWYVEETVPEPGCTATGNGACPTVQALVPEVLLPQNFAVVNADGEITGTNVTLNYANSILNTGSVSAQNLTVNTGTLTNEQRSTNIGTIYQDVSGGVEKTTGTVVQQGGFMSAMNYDLQVQSLNQIGGTLQKVNADGSVDAAGTQAMLAGLKSQLGNQFTQSTVSNQLDTSLIADGGMGPLIAFQMVMLVAISVVTAGAGTGAAIAGFTAGTAEAAAANAAFAALVSSMAGQVMNGQFDLKSIAESVAIATITAGITNGVTYNSNTGSFDFSLTQNVNALPSGVSTLGQLAGVSPGVGTTVPQAGSSLAANLPQQALAIGAEATVQAGVQTAIGGGSFLTNLRNSAISDAAAAGAFDIGEAQGSLNDAEYIAAHALLGCAASAANGTGCAGGAIGAAASAALTPFAADAITGGNPKVTPDQAAAIAAFATFAGGAAAGLAGQNAAAGALAAQNEAINNCLGHPESCAQLAKNALSYLRGPDLINFQLDYYVGSVWGTFTRDGNFFVGGGLNMALPNTVNAGFGVSAGWLNTLTVAPGQTNNFAGGYAGGVSGAYDLVGGGIMYSPGNGSATVVGVGAGVNLGKTTNIGTVGGGYSVDLGKTGIKW
ncbi:filamentous hemagglutinin [Paraburkholderia sabiae]|uniref:Filamentous hemagglutinin n=1 Tax=Paraburkholderia sabiae TaxID=273251 RepID=A0ABU9QMN0_9BURK|nr:filamentous hemagglutinin [Paraburkholderia sabiae]WJZ77262.1 filamentous hemagglutinin [Paraburkholderia sabiae]CAD6514517.1 hypothetical protein LMG24235_00936 [Paraburkholderia sabiae]